MRHAAVALVVLAGCATAAPRERPAHGLDFIDAKGQGADLDALRGQVVIVDLCASWAAACNVNAKVLDEAQDALAGKPVFIVTILIDDVTLQAAALSSYRDVLEVKHAVVLAGPRLRSGTTAFGPATYVPRLMVLDKNGVVRVDDSGGVLSVQGLLAKVEPLL